MCALSLGLNSLRFSKTAWTLSRTWSLCKTGEYRDIAAEFKPFTDTWKLFKSNNTVISYMSPASMRPYLFSVWGRKKQQTENLDSHGCLSAVAVCVSVCVSSECVMSGDTSTLSWRSMSLTSQSDSSDLSPTAGVHRDVLSQVKIIKVCFLSNSPNLGKNFKLIRCEEGWTVKVDLFLLLLHTLL